MRPWRVWRPAGSSGKSSYGSGSREFRLARKGRLSVLGYGNYIRFPVARRYALPFAGVSLFVLLPIDYVWWRVIGYVGQ